MSPDTGGDSFEPQHEIAIVILTQADRPAQLARAVRSVRDQRRVRTQLVLIENGVSSPPADLERPSELADLLIVLRENVGIPAGRNIGAASTDAGLVMFLDDDAELLDPEMLASVVARFQADPRLGAMAIRLVDESGLTQRRHVPRLGARSAARSGPVTYFVGGACVVRTAAFRQVGGFDARFFYSMEESDLAWRLLDAGWSIWYSADLRAFHPRSTPARHLDYARLTARNRLWMAWRSLPVPFTIAYLTTWTAAAVARGAPARDVLAGYRDGLTALPARRPMRWRTVARMTALGRPPLL